MTLQVELVSPEEVLYSGEADMVIARTTDGEIAFMTGHAPFIGSLGVGAVTIRTSEGDDVRAA
ncbi:MAG: F0F1 ATP synthase subunit epsilon, partial [Actinomycetota bacterium]|nr:F0F1 ATP synthase subunit epsilon [Actinomycetota bacterium]